MQVEERVAMPQVSPDIRFYDARTVGRELNRWLFYPGDVIIKRRKDEIDWLAAGGDEVNTPCLIRYGRGYLPRAFITPLELGAEFISPDALPPGVNAQTGIEVNGVTIQSNLVQIPVYPGDALTNIIMKSVNDQGRRRGIVEITSLKGKKWSDCRSFDPNEQGYLDVLDRAYFGDGREYTLRGLEEQIKQGARAFPESAPDANQMLQACMEFRDWGLNRLEQEHTRLRATPTPGSEAPTYSPLAELLLVQLEVERIDHPMASLAQHNAQLGNYLQQALAGIAHSSPNIDMVAFEQRMRDMVNESREGDAKRIAELEAKLAAQTTEMSTDEINDRLARNERPDHIHHKTWAKMRKDAGYED